MKYVAMRNDGFGARLNGLLNAIVLANQFNGEFRFIWPDSIDEAKYHSILPKEEIFDKSFIEQHYIDEKMLKKLKTVTLDKMNSIQNYDAVAVHLEMQDNDRGQYRQAFETIAFAQPLQQAKQRAESINIDYVGGSNRSVAVHMRAGDIVYGDCRFTKFFHTKVAPFPIIMAIIEDLQSNGYEPILFGQDDELMAHLKEKYHVRLAKELSNPSFSSAQQALFDIVLMSRCAKIVAGDSAFAIEGGLIGDVPMVDSYSFFGKDRSLQIIHNTFQKPIDNRISNMQKAFACVSYLYILDKQYANDDISLYLLQEAARQDPANDLYNFILAMTYYNVGRTQDAEQTLCDCFTNNNAENMFRFLTKLWVTSRTAVCSYEAELQAYADKGYPIACLTVSIIAIAYRSFRTYWHYKNQFFLHRKREYAMLDHLVQPHVLFANYVRNKWQRLRGIKVKQIPAHISCHFKAQYRLFLANKPI
ncbi:hypothetical protein AGMMS50229_13610 [Campylobacterota bacterium]|nr:hypothetical protein AGMMS50229_13610 [Campylobacterota bacterium]